MCLRMRVCVHSILSAEATLRRLAVKWARSAVFEFVVAPANAELHLKSDARV